MDINNLTEAEKVSIAKADAAGVEVIARDNNGDIIENPSTTSEMAPKVKPAGLPDKFWNAATGEADYAALAKSYTELEKARGSKPAAEVQATPAAEAAAETPEAKAAAAAVALSAAKAAETPEAKAAAAAAEAAKAAGAVTSQQTIDAANVEWQKDGKLSDATYETLAKTGINKQMVDMYIAGQTATRNAAVAEAYATVGGEESFKAMATWAKASLSPAELAEYNANVATTPSIAKLAVAALHARYVAENGTEGRTVSGTNGGGNANAAGYQTQTEMMAAINDPRYRKDAAYRAGVEAKIGKTADHIV